MTSPKQRLMQKKRTKRTTSLKTMTSTKTLSSVLVSHDTAMLKRACDSIAEITGDAPTADKPGSGRRLETYKSCSFDQWRQQRAERAQRWVSTYERQKEEERDLEDFIRRFGAKASKARQAKDRAGKLETLEEGPLPPPFPTRRSC